MARPKRDPEPIIGEDFYLLVRFTHDVAAARVAMADALVNEGYFDESADAYRKLGDPRLVYVRKVPALPNSYAAAQGWAFAWHECEAGRGASKAVYFRC